MKKTGVNAVWKMENGERERVVKTDRETRVSPGERPKKRNKTGNGRTGPFFVILTGGNQLKRWEGNEVNSESSTKKGVSA